MAITDSCGCQIGCDGAVRPGGLHPAAEADGVVDVGALELPGIAERQPGLRIFLLPAVPDHLLEQAVVVADAEAVGGDAQARHALHEAGGQPPETAIAQRRIRLQRRAAGRGPRRVRPAPAAPARSGRNCSASPAACDPAGTPATGNRPAWGSPRFRRACFAASGQRCGRAAPAPWRRTSRGRWRAADRGRSHRSASRRSGDAGRWLRLSHPGHHVGAAISRCAVRVGTSVMSMKAHQRPAMIRGPAKG